jgi:tRNA A-37 threonylcarbamoyl transferase component Bud32
MTQEERVALALAEYNDLRVRQGLVDREAFCQRHPSLQPELGRQIETMENLQQLLDPGGTPVEGEEIPERLSGHKILGMIGSGGMGRVLLAVDERLGRKVAIKTLSRRYRHNTYLRTRFMQEARAMAHISHPHIARIYNLGPEDEEPHFVMEYLEGVTLTEAAQPLTLTQKAELMDKAALAVDFLHRNQIIHRDLKPANILVGPDLEPKVLDFGLALQANEPGRRLTSPGDVMGTPDYFSPEQARGDAAALDARSDVFSLGAIFYEMLTGAVAFHGETFAELARALCEQDPTLPRRINPAVPGDLQNICLKALEKNPADRYGSARELADDLQRFIAGEPVLALPTAYLRVMTGKIDRHLRELDGWRRDRIVSDIEYDGFLKLYDRLVEREDAWIMEVRRLTLSRVTLYLGAWVLVVGAALVLLFRYPNLASAPSILTVLAAAASTLWLGVRSWNGARTQVAIAYLLAFCLLLPVFCLVTVNECRWLTAPTLGKENLELFSKLPAFKRITNTQLWWSLLASLPAYYWLRRFTRSSVFSLVFSVAGCLLCLVTLLRMGMIDWLDSDPGRVYLHLVPFAILFFATGITVERLRQPADSRYFYPVAVLFTWAALSGVAAFHQPYSDWLKTAAPWTRGQIEYLFILNAGIYAFLQSVFDRVSSAQMRAVAKAFRFVIPGHVLTSLLLLGLAATERWQNAPAGPGRKLEARTFEIFLPVAACFFVFGGIPKQMKNFFATGLLFLAIGIVRLQQNMLKDQWAWPLSLLSAGVLLMLGAANYAPIRMSLSRLRRKLSERLQ